MWSHTILEGGEGHAKQKSCLKLCAHSICYINCIFLHVFFPFKVIKRNKQIRDIL